MGTFSLWHWLLVAMVALLMFGRGRVSELMGDFAKGIKSFKRGMADEDDATTTATTTTAATPATTDRLGAPPAGTTPALERQADARPQTVRVD